MGNQCSSSLVLTAFMADLTSPDYGKLKVFV